MRLNTIEDYIEESKDQSSSNDYSRIEKAINSPEP